MIDDEPLPRTPFGASIPPAATRRPQEIEQLGDAIAELSARIQVATYELLVLIRQFEESGGWNNGCLSVAHWLNWRTGLDLGAAREKVRVARALADLPLLSAAMQRGRLSYSKVRALTRVATRENERRLLDFARCGTAAHVEQLVRAWRQVDRVAEAKDEKRRYQRRELRTWVDDDGMVTIRGRLSPETGAFVIRALEAASERQRQDAAETDPRIEEVTIGQRRADALGLVAESALAADLDRGTAGDRYQVVVHVDEGVLERDDAPGQSALEDGPYVSAETSRRLACDAATVRMRHGPDGHVLGVGRKTRTVPPALHLTALSRKRRAPQPDSEGMSIDALLGASRYSSTTPGDITVSPVIRDKSLRSSSRTPSAKCRSSSAPPRFASGRTASAGRTSLAAAALSGSVGRITSDARGREPASVPPD